MFIRSIKSLEMFPGDLYGDLFRGMFLNMTTRSLADGLRDREDAIDIFSAKYNRNKSLQGPNRFTVRTAGFDPVSGGHVCRTPLCGLREIRDIRKLRDHEVNQGCVIWCTIIRPVDRISGVWALVEDEAKNVFEVGLYNIVPHHVNQRELEQQVLPVGTRLGVKDPYWKMFQDGGVGLRVEHKANVEIRLPTSSSPHVAPEVLVGQPARPGMDKKHVESMKHEGDKLFKTKSFAKAVQAYSQALEAAAGISKMPDALHAGILANRAGCRLELREFKEALLDAEACLAVQCDHARALFRKARALRGLRRYLDALKTLSSFRPDADDKKAAHQLQQDCDELFRKYVLGQIRPQALDHIVDDFYGPVEIRFSPGKGRGLFTTRAVNAGELLLMERPFAKGRLGKHEFQLPTMDFSSMRCFRAEQELMIEPIQSRVSSSAADAARFGLLDDGSDGFEMNVPADMNMFRFDDHPEIARLTTPPPTVKRIREVLVRNCFGGDKVSELYIVCSFMNHSACPNTERGASNKSMNMVVKAVCSLPAGAELFTTYGPEENLGAWGISPEF